MPDLQGKRRPARQIKTRANRSLRKSVQDQAHIVYDGFPKQWIHSFISKTICQKARCGLGRRSFTYCLTQATIWARGYYVNSQCNSARFPNWSVRSMINGAAVSGSSFSKSYS